MFSRIALALIVLIAVPYYWLLMDTGPTSAPMLPIDLARLRAEAARIPGPRPVAIEYAAVATHTSPGTVLVAGGGLKTEETGVFVWRLVTPGGDTVINAGMTPDQALASGFSNFHPAVQTAAQDWLLAAQRILFTSEAIDHVGGFVAVMPRANDVAKHVSGNAAQINAIRQLAPRLSAALAPPVAALSGPPGFAGLGPGIAGIRTPGHLPGSLMIYVQLQDGREYLFAGDTAPMRRNVTWLRPRSRYAAQWLGSEDRAATMGWIKGLAALQAREPGLTVVYGHDLGWLQDPVSGPRFVAARSAARRSTQR
jgi:glyoxylase-like metal-dependent hydrolase (beta-lactamase superfamily II)